IDALRDKMVVEENPQYSQDYLDPNKRSIANQLIVTLANAEEYSEVCEFPLGHKRRRLEGVPLLWRKFEHNCQQLLPAKKASELKALLEKNDWLNDSVPAFMELW
ncbi:MAG TPA: 2-methylcitrate dehydratase, partial [Candidatus Berkiella sp.]|nr:2-methylcitrate dehydratase [Candidatus Berkiella sp.]